jgi:tyrosinase
MKLVAGFLNFFLATFFLLLDHTEAFAITGISAGVNAVTGERPLRRDINDLYMSGPAWDLFILALRQFQQVDQDDPLSYYQVAGKRPQVILERQATDLQGIHGLPQVSWDGVEGRGEYPGYCSHAAVTFPTWHRPYIALFEVRNDS